MKYINFVLAFSFVFLCAYPAQAFWGKKSKKAEVKIESQTAPAEQIVFEKEVLPETQEIPLEEDPEIVAQTEEILPSQQPAVVLAGTEEVKTAPSSGAGAASLNPLGQEEVINKFIAWDKNLKTVEVYFEQGTDFEGVPISTSAGRIYKKDNKIRLDTLQEGKVTQSAVTDKKTIRILDEKGKFITSLSWAQWQSSQANQALFDFGNYAALVKKHTVKEFKKEGGFYRIVLTDNAKTGYELEFLLDDKDFFPKEITISSEGVKTVTELTEIKKNTDIKESVFK